jgi:hypothetical protein
MRKIIYAGIALASLFLNSCGPTHVVVEEPVQQSPPPPPPPAPEVSYQSFYDALSPYGQWIDNPQYGYVWMPNVGPDFKPYATNGIGYIRMAAGPGLPITPGAGLPSTMAAGSLKTVMAGCGSRQ